MAALAVKTLTPRSCERSAHRLMRKDEKNSIEGLYGVSSHKTYYRESRRALLWKFVGLGAAISHVNSTLSAPLVDMKDPEIIRYQKLRSGVKIEEIVEGQGPEAHEGDIVEVNYVCRRSNGYFVHSTVDQFSGESKPVVLSLDGKEVIQGLKDVLVGMKVGGKRRALIPPSLGYVNESLKPIPDVFGPRRSLLSHAKEPLIFEVQLLKLL